MGKIYSLKWVYDSISHKKLLNKENYFKFEIPGEHKKSDKEFMEANFRLFQRLNSNFTGRKPRSIREVIYFKSIGLSNSNHKDQILLRQKAAYLTGTPPASIKDFIKKDGGRSIEEAIQGKKYSHQYPEIPYADIPM